MDWCFHMFKFVHKAPVWGQPCVCSAARPGPQPTQEKLQLWALVLMGHRKDTAVQCEVRAAGVGLRSARTVPPAQPGVAATA